MRQMKVIVAGSKGYQVKKKIIFYIPMQGTTRRIFLLPINVFKHQNFDNCCFILKKKAFE